MLLPKEGIMKLVLTLTLFFALVALDAVVTLRVARAPQLGAVETL
jgi:hypothetical protein